MSIVLLLLPIALLLASSFVAAFVWAGRHGQYDDLDTPAYRILLDDSERKAR
ncbi:MAG: cbb3-type cytochrome oxidase assembly protein CcoS [Deltaproteobacteria bacterium]|nr:cbb3-type cytochrome oxidase assembly protein CcoS [Deltaproteobacteria bacterium]